MRLIGRDQIPNPDSVGDWLRRMGDADKEQAGLLGLGKVRDEINRRILRHDGISQFLAHPTLAWVEGRIIKFPPP